MVGWWVDGMSWHRINQLMAFSVQQVQCDPALLLDEDQLQIKGGRGGGWTSPSVGRC
jgi:hypothetical protein